MQTRRILAICLGVLVVVAVCPVHAQRNDNKRSQQEQMDTQALYATVDAVISGARPAPVDIPVTLVQHHFLMAQGGTMVIPFTVSIDKSKVRGPAVFYVRAVDKDAPMGTPPSSANKDRDNKNNRNKGQAGPTYPFSVAFSGEIPADGKMSRAVELKPGRYELFFALTEKGSADPKAAVDSKNPAASIKAGLLRQDLTVPDLSTGFGTSSIILANSVEPVTSPLPPDQLANNPYTIGNVLKIVPNITSQFATSAELTAIFWVYGVTSVTGKPDVQIEFNFHQKSADGEKYFNKTAPQQYNAQTSAPEFNLDTGHQLLAIQSLPLKSFPAGDYRLEIKVTDKPSGKTVTQNVNFAVLGG